VGPVFAERGDFEMNPAVHHDNDAKGSTHSEGLGKDCTDFFRSGVGRDVIVFGDSTAKVISHAAACKKGAKTMLTQYRANLTGLYFNLSHRAHVTGRCPTQNV